MPDTTLGHAYVAARDMVDGLPVVPAQYTAHAEIDGWYSVWRDDGEILLAAWRANTLANGQSLFAIFGPRAVLETISGAMPARELWDLALAGNAQAIAVVRRWPTWRFSGHERDKDGNAIVATNVVRRVIFEGQSMPAPPMPTPAVPWRFAANGTIVATDGAAQYRIGSIVRPALPATLAGFALDSTLESEPTR